MKVLITGAGSGIGAAVTDVLAARGDELWLVARSAERAAQWAERWPAAQLLVADLGAVAEGDLTGWELPDTLDGVVLSAGVVQLGTVEELRLADLRHQLEVNAIGGLAVVQRCLPALRRGSGTVVWVNSGAGLTAHAGWGAYAASKFAAKAMADALRAEESPYGVRVTSVFPGRTATPMQEQVRAQEGAPYVEEDYMPVANVAGAVVVALDQPRGSVMHDITVRP